MPEDFLTIVRQLEDAAAYDGPWRPLREEAGLLRERVRELREREKRLDDLLVVALVGGSGVGKSTVLNAIAGDELAPTSEFRPCTSVPTVYYPPGARLDFPHEAWRRVSGSALEHLVIIDTPDSDTVVREHRAIVQDALAQSDLIVICGSPEKYLDEATWSLLRPLRGERTLVCVETKARGDSDNIREHWLRRLSEQGFRIAAYFRVNALHTFDRKLQGRNEPDPEEFDWPRFEDFLHRELTRERIQRIKRSNTVGLLRKSVARVYERIARRADELDALARRLEELDQEVTRGAYEILARRVFAEPYLWAHAQDHEVAIRAKGIVGGFYKILVGIRNLPARIAGGWTRFGAGAGRPAVDLLADRRVLESDSLLSPPEIKALYNHRQSELALDFAKAGFELAPDGKGFADFERRLRERATEVLRGPARDRLVRRARLLTSWPVTLAADAVPLAFLAYSAYLLVRQYLEQIVPPGMAFVQAALVFAVLMGTELLALSLASRLSAWSARQGALRDLRAALSTHGEAFNPERTALAQTRALARALERLEGAVARVTQG